MLLTVVQVWYRDDSTVLEGLKLPPLVARYNGSLPQNGKSDGGCGNSPPTCRENNPLPLCHSLATSWSDLT